MKDLAGWGVTLVIIAFVFFIGFMMGEARGFSDGIDAHTKNECESKYYVVPQKDIPGYCLKYFKTGGEK